MKPRRNSLWWGDAEEGGPIVRAAVGEFSAPTYAAIGVEWVRAQGEKGEFSHGREVTSGMAFANSAVVFPKDDVEHPMHAFPPSEHARREQTG